MQVEQRRWTATHGWDGPVSRPAVGADLVLVFGSRAVLQTPSLLESVRRSYPAAHLFGCSTAGEIAGTDVTDNSLVATAVTFAGTAIVGAHMKVPSPHASYDVGCDLARRLPYEGLVHVLVLSDGLAINGSDLVRGMADQLPDGVTITGGLSGDGERFEETLVMWDGPPERDTVAVVGLYGDRLRIGFGSLGGWDPFGPERLITRSDGNILYEFGGQSALELYKRYLGEHAAGLPATALLYPLSIRTREGEVGVVRTVLSIDEQAQSMTFAGNIPQGAYARLMKANFDRLIDGAVGAARTSHQAIGGSSPELALLISCVGRKMVLKQRVEEEVEGVREVLGPGAVLSGFYSYGEISPFTPNARCELHNQTMTITTFSEA